MLIKSAPSSALRIVVLGSSKSGKSAVTVRYLTKRFIGEYSSSKDFLYHQTLNHANGSTEIEILDTSDGKQTSLAEHILWAEAFVIIYSICDLRSFQYAKRLIEKICTIKSSPSSPTEANNNFYSDETYNDEENLDIPQCPTGNSQLPVILLGNKRDLEHTRQVQISEVEEFALRYQLLFYEVSAAESFVGVSLAFQSLIREATRSTSQPQPSNSPPTANAFQCTLSKEDSLRLSFKPAYCCGYLENRHLISDSYSTSDYRKASFKANSCGSSSSSDASLKGSDKYQLNSRRKSMTVKSMFGNLTGNLFGSKSSRQKKKRPSLSI